MSEPSTQGGGQIASTDEVGSLFGLLADEHCRTVLTYFHEEPVEVASIGEIQDSEYYATRGGDEEKLAIMLHHVTMPKLEACDVVDYDQQQQIVRSRQTALVESVLEACQENSRV